MKGVNLAFVDDEDNQVKKEAAISLSDLKGSEGIDYSKATSLPLVFSALVVAYSSLLLGTTFGWSSAVQPELRGLTAINQTTQDYFWHITLNDDEMSWAGSLVNLGALVGAVCGALLMDKYGRRLTLILMSIPYITGWLVVTLAVNAYMFYFGRVIVGFAAGVCSVVVPCYIGEISTPPMRGPIGFFFAMYIPMGLLTVSIMGIWLHWRWISAVCTMEPLLFLLGLIFVPESPYFSITKGRTTDAMEALKWLRGVNYNCEEELNQLVVRVDRDVKETARLMDLTHSWVYKPVLISITLMILQQCSGSSIANFNAADIVRMSDPSRNGNVGVVWINLVQTVTGILSCFLVKKFARRTLFITAEGIAVISMVCLGLFFYLNDGEEEIRVAWLPLVSLIVLYTAVSIGLGPIPWSLPSEIIPTKFRGFGSSIIVIVNFVTSFIVTKTYVNMQREMTSAGVFWYYGSISFAGIFFGLFFMPETKDRTYDEIQAMFRGSSKTTVPQVNPF